MKEYYSNKKILEKNAEYNIILGERSNGKSYCIKMEQCLKKAIKQEKCTFVIIKRLSEDIKAGFIEEYFADMPISKLTKGKYNKIVGYRDGIYLAKAIDGVYNDDPRKNPNAKKYDEVSIDEVIEKNLQVVDMTASILARDNKMPMWVFDLTEKNSILNAVSGQFTGTRVTVS